MKKYLLYAWVAVIFCSCSESGLDTVPMDVDAACVNIVNDENFVSVSQASEVAGLFMNANGNEGNVTTRNGSVAADKVVKDIKTIYGEDKTPSMYVINYEGGGFVIVSATKNYYPILAYSETGSMNVEAAMKTGFSVWADEAKQNIEESNSQDEEMLDEFRKMWALYEVQPVTATANAAPTGTYEDGVIFRKRLGELYSLCPGYSFGPLTSARSFLSQSEYDSYVAKAELYGSPLEFTIVGYKSDPHETVGPLINTAWHQNAPFNALCPPNCPAGCVAIAMAQIMKYHEWPPAFNWSDMPNTTATLSTQTLIADIGDAVDMEYGTDASSSNIDKAQIGFGIRGYTAVKKDHDFEEVEKEIFLHHRPVYMRGNQKNFIGISWDGHAWVCEGADRWSTCANYFVEYLVNRSTNPSYSSCGIPSYLNPQRSSGSGYLRFYMNWGWGMDNGNGWYSFSSSDSGNGDFKYDRKNLYVSPNK